MAQNVLTANPRDTYRKQGVLTASPIELIVMLYDGLKKYLVLAQRAMMKSDVEAAHKCVIRCEDIVSELMNSLDLSFSISKELLSLYEFMLHSLQQINIKKDPTMIAPVLEIVEELRETWKEVAAANKGTLSVAD